VPLVLHGGSSSGDENLSKAAALGITKVNIYTDLAKAALHAAQEEPYESVLKMIEAEQKAVEALDEHYVDVFNTAKLHQIEEKTVLGAL
jgi:fructose/tagatose bisphosphate aldolase